ncbi:MAG TPA: hypothetical protein VHD36_07960 [Pirellulales bacterium]|nr:hypothetical protein [Pirellulales bacterium]
MKMRSFFAVVLCAALGASGVARADDTATTTKDDDKPVTTATDKPAAAADDDDAKPVEAKPAAKPAAPAAPKPAAAPVAPLGGGLRARGPLRANPQPGAPRPAADALRAGVRAGVRAAVQAPSELQPGEPFTAPADGEAPATRRPPGPAGDRPYAPPGGFGPGPDGPPPPDGPQPPPPPRGAAPPPPPHGPQAAPPPRVEGGHYDRLLRGGDLNNYDRLTRPVPQRYGTSPDDPEMQKLNTEEARLEAHARDTAVRYRTTTDEIERDKLRGELEDFVLQQFEVRQQRRQLELERLEQQLKRLREAIDKRTSSRDTLIKQRIEQLVGEESDLGF